MTPTSSTQFTADDFNLDVRPWVAETLVADHETYWRGAWRRLRQHRSAWISLWLIAFIFAFCWLGPLIWQVDPATQDLDQMSRAPALTHQALLTTDRAPWRGVHQTLPPIITNPREKPNTSTDQLSVIEPAHTDAVRITWSPVYNADRYTLFRHEFKPSARTDLGVPIVEILEPGLISFEDRLLLENRRYYYSVVAGNEAGYSDKYSSIAVDVLSSISRSEAEKLQLDYALLNQPDGTMIDLPSHPLGTDYLGRDILARLMHAGRTSLFIGISAPLCFIAIGMLYGSLAGYLGGKIDEIMMRFADFIIALPFLLFMILFKVAFGLDGGDSGILPMLLAMVLLGWPDSARLARGQIIQLRQQYYVQNARLQGANALYIIRVHMLPNLLSIILVSLSFAIPAAIFTEAFLSFIGLGVVPPIPSWGSMCNDGIKTMLSYPYELFFPAFFISISVLAFNLLGDGLRDALDVKMESF